MTLSDIEKDLESHRCPFCNELHECLTEHNKDCKVRSEVMAEMIKCKICPKEFATYGEFLKHWNKDHKDKHGSYGKDKKEDQSEEKKKEDKTKKEEKENLEDKKEDKKEEKKDETKEDTKEPEKKKEDKKEDKEEIEEVKEPEKKKEPEKDPYTLIKEAKGNILDKTTALILKGQTK